MPESLDAAVVDMGDRLEVSILVTNYLKKLGVPEIVAKAESDQHGEILRRLAGLRGRLDRRGDDAAPAQGQAPFDDEGQPEHRGDNQDDDEELMHSWKELSDCGASAQL